MFKFLNCFLSSFFRTLGRIIVYILLGVVFSTILSKIDVHADVKLNGSILNYKDYIYVDDGNRTFEFNDDTLYYADQVPQNFIATFCSSDDKITSWYSNINDSEFPHELNIYKTNIPCQYSTSDYTGGTITYFYGKSFTCPASGNNPTCSSWGKWTFYSYSGSYQLLNFITTNDDISIDFSSGAVISQNQQIINQNQEIINGQNNIINNQNSNTDKTIDSQRVCQEIGINNGLIFHKRLDEYGNEVEAGTSSITDYYLINGGTIENILPRNPTTTYSCFYDKNKNLISCFKNDLEGIITIPTNAHYVRFTIQTNSEHPTFKICQSGNQAISGGLNDINGSINNSDTTDATNDANNFFNNFTTDTHGLTGIITAPLNAINSLTNKTCSPLVLPLPFVDKNLTLPCMRSIYDDHFGAFMTLYDTITFGIVSYWVCVRIFSFVKDFKNPEHDEIEVVDL